MSDSTRRGFLALAGAGVAAGAAAVAMPGAAGAATEDTSVPKGAAPEMVVHVEDVHAGRARLMVDGGEVLVTDKALVARIARAYARARQD